MLRGILATLFGLLVVVASSGRGIAMAQEPALQATPVPPTAASTVPYDLQAAGDYCLMQGGILLERWPFVGVDTAVPIKLAGSRWFCEFTGSPEAEPPSSRISIGLATLYAQDPTLAALAYLVKPPIPNSIEATNLAADYCTHLGGSSELGGDNGVTGGWASDPDNPSLTSITMCIFADGSAIDDWGLAYNTRGTIRGTNLAPLLRYQPSSLPTHVFPQANAA